MRDHGRLRQLTLTPPTSFRPHNCSRAFSSLFPFSGGYTQTDREIIRLGQFESLGVSAVFSILPLNSPPQFHDSYCQASNLYSLIIKLIVQDYWIKMSAISNFHTLFQHGEFRATLGSENRLGLTSSINQKAVKPKILRPFNEVLKEKWN